MANNEEEGRCFTTTMKYRQFFVQFRRTFLILLLSKVRSLNKVKFFFHKFGVISMLAVAFKLFFVFCG